MSGARLFHEARDIEVDVRIIMRAEGLADLSIPACKEWSRKFIKQLFPLWIPGSRLSQKQQEDVGAAFAIMLSRAKDRPDKLGWQQ